MCSLRAFRAQATAGEFRKKKRSCLQEDVASCRQLLLQLASRQYDRARDARKPQSPRLSLVQSTACTVAGPLRLSSPSSYHAGASNSSARVLVVTFLCRGSSRQTAVRQCHNIYRPAARRIPSLDSASRACSTVAELSSRTRSPALSSAYKCAFTRAHSFCLVAAAACATRHCDIACHRGAACSQTGCELARRGAQ